MSILRKVDVPIFRKSYECESDLEFQALQRPGVTFHKHPWAGFEYR